MKNDEKEVKTSDVENLIDGKHVPVKFAPKQGQKQAEGSIFVRRIPIFDMDPLGRVFGKIAAEAALYCDKDEAWIRSLSEESFAEVLTTGRQLNFTSFKKWYQWQEETLDALGQGEDRDKLIQKVVAELNKKPGENQSPSASASSS